MRDRLPCFHLSPSGPPFEASVSYILEQRKPRVADLMAAADRDGRVLIQARSGVGDQTAMIRMLREIASHGTPDILSLTIDSYTRLGLFGKAASAQLTNPALLNGYPLVAHGHRKVRELDAAFQLPIQVRHGSPDGRRLFAESIAGGLSSFEGGGIGYNIPYCKDVPLAHSLACWREIDDAVALLADAGLTVEREMFGSLSGVLVPPSIALSCVLLEAILAVRAGCIAISLSVPQGGHLVQDVAALISARRLCVQFLPKDVCTHVVLHQYMGVFPKDRGRADALIFMGGLTAKLGRATKVITKTYQEAIGSPDANANNAGLCLTRAAMGEHDWCPPLNDSEVEEEVHQIMAEVIEIVMPILGRSPIEREIVRAFESGRLDVPFPANKIAHGNVIPVRDPTGAIRFAKTGALPFSSSVKRGAIKGVENHSGRGGLSAQLRESVMYFA